MDNNKPKWKIITTEYFDLWFDSMLIDIKIEIVATVRTLAHIGPILGRPYVDTVKDSKYANMKELRVQNKGNPIRIFFAFDPIRQAILLCGDSKKGKNEKKFYQNNIKKADKLFADYLRSNR